MTIYAKIDFETGDFSQISGIPWLGAIAQSPPDAVCEIVSDIVREGNYAMRSYQSNPAVANRSKVVLSEVGHWGLKQAYYGFSFYLSPTLKTLDWLQIFEVDQFIPPSSYPHLIQLQIANPVGGTVPYLHIVQTGEAPWNALWTSPLPVPLGSWIDVVLYLDIDVNGTVKLWLNRNLVAELHLNTTGGEQSPAGFPEFGLYQDVKNAGGNWVVHDRFVIADTFEEASIPVLAGISPWVIGILLLGVGVGTLYALKGGKK